MSDYHPYVFDESRRAFVGRFEEMYQAENANGFDSWHQEDLRDPSKKICLALLDGYNFGKILDVGCGKGAFTQLLKKKNNRVLALDISSTALKTAQARYPDIDYMEADLATQRLEAVTAHYAKRFDLAVCLETLSYLANWKEAMADFSRVANFALVSLFLPENPIGFVKSPAELAGEFARHFEIIEDIRLLTQKRIVVFGKSRLSNGE